MELRIRKSSLGHVARGWGPLYTGSYRAIPDLVTPGGLTIKLESAGPELADDLAIKEAREAAHLCGHHNHVVAASRSRGKRDFFLTFAACLYELSRNVSRDVEGLGKPSVLAPPGRT